MKFQIKEQAAIVLKKQKKHRIYITAVSMACVLTIFGVVYGLTRPGRAFSSLEKTLDCHVMDEVHQHTAECYDEDGNLICGIADFVAHEHDPETCYDENGELVCTLPEIPVHIHDDSCYLDRLVLVCGIEEGQVVDPEGNPVFDANGEPVYEFENIPEDILMAFNGEAEEAEIVPEEDDAAIEGTTDEEDSEEETTLEGEAEEADPEETTDKADSDKADETETTTTEEPATTEGTAPAEGTATTEEAAPAEGTATTEEATPAEEPAATEEAAPAEEPATTEEAAPTEELITENVEMNQGAAPEDLYKGFTKHVHTSECYKVEKELTCTIPGIHVHTKDCYDEDGNLICGQLQLSVHVHDDDCYVYEEKKVTVTATAGDYLITATYGASAKIPSKAEFRARIIEPDTEEYLDAEETALASAEEDLAIQVMFDIGFYIDDEEIEPEGPVDVTFTLNSEDIDTESDITIIHLKNDGDVELNEAEIDEENNASLTFDSFSKVLIAQGSNRAIGKIEIDNAFANSEEFAPYRLVNNELGVAANFMVVAFDTYYAEPGHQNGNICVNNLIQAPNNFGTNNRKWEISYIRNMPQNSNLLTANPGTSEEGCAIVFGAGTNVRTDGSSIYANGRKLDSPPIVYVEGTDNGQAHRFVDLEQLQLDVKDWQDKLAKNSNGNASIGTIDNIPAFILGEHKDSAGFLNFTAEEFKQYANIPMYMGGFSSTKDHAGTLIININCEGVEEFTLSGNHLMKGHNFGETPFFDDGKIIYNFYNSSNTKIKFTNGDFVGIILAPYADVEFDWAGAFDGQVIANNVHLAKESHRVSFTGTKIPFTATIKFGKFIDENGVPREPNGNEKFTFRLWEHNGTTWVQARNKDGNLIPDAVNNGSEVDFGSISYDKEGIHWYKVTEIEGENSAFIYDKTEYLLKIDVHYGADGKTLEGTPVYYKLTNGDKDITYINGKPAGVKQGVSEASLTDRTFNNTPNLTFVKVEKKWLDYKGNESTKFPEGGIKVYLYRTTAENANKPDVSTLTPDNKDYFVQEATLNKPNWSHVFENLPIKDKNGSNYIYFVKEEDLSGYVVSYSNGTWFAGGLTQKITNREIPEKTFVEVKKEFYAFDVNGKPLKITDLKNAGISDNDYVEVGLIQVATLNGKTTKSEYVGPAKLNGQDVSFTKDTKIVLNNANDWYSKVEELPKGIINDSGDFISYEYEIKELTCSIASYGTYDDEKTGTNIEKQDKLFIVKNLLKPTGLEIDKTWLAYTGTAEQRQLEPTDPTVITVDLWRFDADVLEKNPSYADDPETYGSKVGTISLGASSVSSDNLSVSVARDENGNQILWTAVIDRLNAYYVSSENGKTVLKKYAYVAKESAIDGYELSDGSNLEATLSNGEYNNIVLVNKCNSAFTLPETGSGKLIPIYIAGALTMLASGALLVYRRKLRNN